MSAKLPIWAILSSVFFQKAHTRATGKPQSSRLTEGDGGLEFHPVVLVAHFAFARRGSAVAPGRFQQKLVYLTESYLRTNAGGARQLPISEMAVWKEI